MMYEDQQFQIISKALHSTSKSLEEQIDFSSQAVLQIDQAKKDFIRALSHATDINHQVIIDTLYDQ